MDLEKSVADAVQGRKYPIAKLISVFEDSRVKTASERKKILSLLQELNQSNTQSAKIIGITGTPGSGKSTLLDICARTIIKADEKIRVCILAIDPSSAISKGSLLGDRTRSRFPIDENRLYFRSQATQLELGGIGRHTYQVCRLLKYLFDIIFIETVGIGQNEIEINHIADIVYLVLQPLGGDQIQFMKSGIMEIPDAFIINKCDAKNAALKSYHSLKSSLDLIRPDSNKKLQIHLVSAAKNIGIDELVKNFLEFHKAKPLPSKEMARQKYFFQKWIQEEYGHSGSRVLQTMNADIYSILSESYEDAQQSFQNDYSRLLR